MKALARGFYAQFFPEYPQEPTLIGGEPSRSGGSVYQSNAEMVAAVRNPLYKTSAAYRAEHNRKLARPDVFNGGRA